MALDYIRRQYGVSAKRGTRVRYLGKHLGTIVGSYHQYIRVRLDGEKRSRIYHPTWEMEYLSNEGAA